MNGPYLKIAIYDANGKLCADVGVTDPVVLMDALEQSTHPLLRKAAELLDQQLHPKEQK